MKRTIVVKVFRQGVPGFDLFEFSSENGIPQVALPEGEPYYGKRFHLSTDGDGGYQFTPDAAECWIRFGVNSPSYARDEEYDDAGKPVLYLFNAYEGERDAELDRQIEALKKRVAWRIYDEQATDKENLRKMIGIGFSPDRLEDGKQMIALLKKRMLF